MNIKNIVKFVLVISILTNVGCSKSKSQAKPAAKSSTLGSAAKIAASTSPLTGTQLAKLAPEGASVAKVSAAKPKTSSKPSAVAKIAPAIVSTAPAIVSAAPALEASPAPAPGPLSGWGTGTGPAGYDPRALHETANSKAEGPYGANMLEKAFDLFY